MRRIILDAKTAAQQWKTILQHLVYNKAQQTKIEEAYKAGQLSRWQAEAALKVLQNQKTNIQTIINQWEARVNELKLNLDTVKADGGKLLMEAMKTPK